MVEMNDLTNYIEKNYNNMELKYINSSYGNINLWVSDSKYYGVDLHLKFILMPVLIISLME